MIIQKRFKSALAVTGLLVASAATPVVAATSVALSGTGATYRRIGQVRN